MRARIRTYQEVTTFSLSRFLYLGGCLVNALRIRVDLLALTPGNPLFISQGFESTSRLLVLTLGFGFPYRPLLTLVLFLIYLYIGGHYGI